MTGDTRWAFTFLGPFAAKEHFCCLAGSAFEHAENTSIEFFALKILSISIFGRMVTCDFWLRVGGGGEHTASLRFFT
jgi:hypothetical protein